MKLHLKSASWYILAFLISISAFLPALSSRIPFIGITKELAQVAVIGLLILVSMRNKSIEKNQSLLLIGIFSVYCLLHIIGERNLALIVDGVRFQVGYIVIAFLLLLNSSIITSDRFEQFVKIIAIQGMVVSVIGCIEFFSPEIIGIIYGVDKSDMSHVTLAAGDRLISTFSNPINYGVFLCFALAANFYFAIKTNKTKAWLIFWFATLIYAGLIFFTLSRLALLAFLAMMAYFYAIGIMKKEKITIGVFCLSILMLLPIAFSLIKNNPDLLYRISNLISIETYTKNARVTNWLTALSEMDNPLYFLWGLGAGASNPAETSGGLMIENGYISNLIDFGLIGFILYLLIIVRAIINRRNIENSHNTQIHFINAFFIAFLVMNLGNDLNRNFPFVMYFWVIIAYISSFKPKQIKNQNEYCSRRL
ncbi:O-antigen ligase family protein [Photobacterium sp. DNB22_13_2]